MLPVQDAIVEKQKSFTRLVSHWLKNVEDGFFGGFFDDGTTAWLVCGSRLLVIDICSSTKIAAYLFKDYSIECGTACKYSDGRKCLLLSIQNKRKYLLCCFDVCSSRIIEAISFPAPIVTIAVLNDATKKLINPVLQSWPAIGAAGVEGGRLFLCPINLSSGENCSDEFHPDQLPVVSVKAFCGNRALVDISESYYHSESLIKWLDRSKKWIFIDAETAAPTASMFISETSLLAVGYSFGSILLFSLETLKTVYVSLLESGALSVTKMTLVEPQDDPRRALYLWVCRDRMPLFVDMQETLTDTPSFEMFQLYFDNSNDETDDSDDNETETKKDDTPVLSICVSRIYWCPHNCAEIISCDSTGLCVEKSDIETDDTRCSGNNFAYFTWYNEHGNLVGCLFDINSWYNAQMPGEIIFSSKTGICPYVALHQYDVMRDEMLLCIPTKGAIVRHRDNPDSEFNYYCCSYSLSMDVVTCDNIVKYNVPNVQTVIMKKLEGSIVDLLHGPGNIFSLMRECKLISTIGTASAKEMRHQIWSVMLSHNRLHYLRNCWTEISTDSVLQQEFIGWIWSQAVANKKRFNELCKALFDVNLSGISMSSLRTLQQQLSDLSSILILYGLITSYYETSALEDSESLSNRLTALRQACLHAHVIVWAVEAKCLPERAGVYCRKKLEDNYREKKLNSRRTLFIDEFINEMNENLDEGIAEGIQFPLTYPFASLRDIFSIYLIPTVQLAAKHAIVYYTLLDLRDILSDSAAEDIDNVKNKFAERFIDLIDNRLAKFITLIHESDKGTSNVVLPEFEGDILDMLQSYKELEESDVRNGLNFTYDCRDDMYSPEGCFESKYREYSDAPSGSNTYEMQSNARPFGCPKEICRALLLLKHRKYQQFVRHACVAEEFQGDTKLAKICGALYEKVCSVLPKDSWQYIPHPKETGEEEQPTLKRSASTNTDLYNIPKKAKVALHLDDSSVPVSPSMILLNRSGVSKSFLKRTERSTPMSRQTKIDDVRCLLQTPRVIPATPIRTQSSQQQPISILRSGRSTKSKRSPEKSLRFCIPDLTNSLTASVTPSNGSVASGYAELSQEDDVTFNLSRRRTSFAPSNDVSPASSLHSERTPASSPDSVVTFNYSRHRPSLLNVEDTLDRPLLYPERDSIER